MQASHGMIELMPGAVRHALLGLLLVAAPALAQATMQPPQVAPPGVLDTVQYGRFDKGKMWTFEYPPTRYLTETYNFTPDSSWYRRARLGALRIPGCSASLVSGRGLVMTNHHCGRDAATEVKRGSENILDNGFYARNENDERRAESMYADQLIAIVDVTAQVDSAANAAGTGAAAAQAREQVQGAIVERLKREHGETDIEVEVIALWAGAKTSAYVFKRYKDVRLVMTPELQIGYFGGDPDNFTYPRYSLDFTFFRIYGADGRPLTTPEHFRWSPDGVQAGDLVFVIGNPGSTSRLQTVAELEFRRDVRDLGLVRLLSDRVDVYQEFIEAHPGAPETTRNQLFEFLNAEKAYSGMLEGLRDPYIMARRRAEERAFMDSVRAKPALAQKYGDLLDRMADVQMRKRALEQDAKALTAFGHPTLDASVLRRGLYASQYLAGKSGGAPEQMLNSVLETIGSVPAQPKELQEGLLAGRLRDVAWAYGPSSAEAQRILDGRSPEVLAAAIMQSPLADSARAVQALRADSVSADDPAVRVGRELLRRVGAFQGQMAQFNAQEEDISREIGRARFEIFGTTEPPDATFSLRLADGVVRGYEYNGTVAPVYTTLYGLYDRHYSHGGDAWDLPNRWLDRSGNLQLRTPANFISTADIIGGNSGSPVVDKDLRVVGLVFDGNIESLPGDYIYLDRRARAVAVDVRGILESLRSIYQADRLVRELTSGR